ncbi:hypothetical protein [Streptomyces sp. NBC_00120]|uniref:hypothetical protein n=1 Tax=Streptomyces sp. NBC_00120 TaxID=2975660 RepID=UPI002252D787|nr:hypothetical protein [Streptomyces sp. NBC_00120]MCX5326270.1 hypothetical protein [Streptomyces sp. NBC_00120]
MAMRGSATWRTPGSPMVSFLRDIDRRTRTTTRRSRPATPPQPPKEAGPEPATVSLAAAPPTVVAAVVETGEDGRAQWEFPPAFSRPPALTALPVDPNAADDTGTFVAALESVSETHAELRVWRTRPLPDLGAVEPAGAGIRVHVTATPTTA